MGFSELADDIFSLFAFLNIYLLSITVIASLTWSVVSHYLNMMLQEKLKYILFIGQFLQVDI